MPSMSGVGLKLVRGLAGHQVLENYMKSDLTGRVIGFSVPHILDPSQVEEPWQIFSERTVWGRVMDTLPDNTDLLRVEAINGDGAYVIPRCIIHTTMPESYHV